MFSGDTAVSDYVSSRGYDGVRLGSPAVFFRGKKYREKNTVP